MGAQLKPSLALAHQLDLNVCICQVIFKTVSTSKILHQFFWVWYLVPVYFGLWMNKDRIVPTNS